MFKHNIFWYFQTFAVYCSNLISKFFLNKKVYGLENIKGLKGGKVLFVSNHQGLFDPFVIGPSLPRSYLRTVKAYRLLTYYKYIKLRWYGPLIWLAGAYSVHPRGGKDIDLTLESTLRFLNRNQCIMIFPTGKRIKDINPEDARQGAGYVAKKANPVIVPALVSGTYRISILDFILRRRHIKIVYGKPFYYRDIADENDDYGKISVNIMKKVKELEAKV